MIDVKPPMRYLVAIEDGELVKMSDRGFESTGMFLINLPRDLLKFDGVMGRMHLAADT